MLPGDVIAHCDNCGVIWEPAAFEPRSPSWKKGSKMNDFLFWAAIIVIGSIIISMIGSCGIS